MFGGMMPTEWMDVGSAAAWIVMLIPFWLGSVWIERRAINKRIPERHAAQISRAVVRGNLASYSLFLILGLIALSSAIDDLPNQKARFVELRESRERRKQQRGEQDVADQSATAPEPQSENNEKPKPESEVHLK